MIIVIWEKGVTKYSEDYYKVIGWKELFLSFIWWKKIKELKIITKLKAFSLLSDLWLNIDTKLSDIRFENRNIAWYSYYLES